MAEQYLSTCSLEAGLAPSFRLLNGPRNLSMGKEGKRNGFKRGKAGGKKNERRMGVKKLSHCHIYRQKKKLRNEKKRAGNSLKKGPGPKTIPAMG